MPEMTSLKTVESLSKSQETVMGGRTGNGNVNSSGKAGGEMGKEDDFRMLSRFTVGGSLNSSRPDMGRKGKRREEWEMSVLGSRKWLRKGGGDEEDLMNLVGKDEEEDRIMDGVRDSRNLGVVTEISAARGF
ncbi:hypothetical protein NHQ30_003849 [Ciborinia camelliae]|nr:hypothetical protein NHQ30_003849 [Ciborinia camelliae]